MPANAADRSADDSFDLIVWSVDIVPERTPREHERAAANIADWLGHLESEMQTARGQGARVISLDQFAAARHLARCVKKQEAQDIVSALAAEGARLLAVLETLSHRYGLAVIAGSLPIPRAAGPRRMDEPDCMGRSWLLLPDGVGGVTTIAHDGRAVLASLDSTRQKSRGLDTTAWCNLTFVTRRAEIWRTTL